jgi:hypothetical protein
MKTKNDYIFIFLIDWGKSPISSLIFCLENLLEISRCESFSSYRVQASRYIQSTCATTGEGLDWLSSNIASKVCDRLSVTIVLLCDQSGDNSYIWPFFYAINSQ